MFDDNSDVTSSPPLCFVSTQISFDKDLYTEKEKLVECCKLAHNAKAVEKGSDYSQGTTYFIGANEASRCPLESLAKEIFRYHTEKGQLKGIHFDPSSSGSEWWCQVIDSVDDISFHWDRDYGIEQDSGKHFYPQLGTVTYLSLQGGPTVIVNKEGTGSVLETYFGEIMPSPPLIGTGVNGQDQVIVPGEAMYILSKPKILKHISFEGTLLHGSSTDFETSNQGGGDSDDESTDSASTTTNRITFLVNIWLDHIPTHADKPPENLLAQLCEPKLQLSSLPKFVDISHQPTMHLLVNDPASGATDVRNLVWNFMSSDLSCDIFLPTFQGEKVKSLWDNQNNMAVCSANVSGYLYEAVLCPECYQVEDASDNEKDSDDSGDDDRSDDLHSDQDAPLKKVQRLT